MVPPDPVPFPPVATVFDCENEAKERSEIENVVVKNADFIIVNFSGDNLHNILLHAFYLDEKNESF